MNFSIFDIETDGLLDTVTKTHCLCYINYNNGVRTTGQLTKPEDIINFITNQNILIGHRIVEYDIPALKKIYNIEIKARLIDTLGLSWYLFPKIEKHGLEDWGEYFGVPKPKIDDWQNLTQEEYLHRCTEDTKINEQLWIKQINLLKLLYDNSTQAIDRILNYITFKLDCAEEQYRRRIKLDIPVCKRNLSNLLEEKNRRAEALSQVMPKQIIYTTYSRPKVMVKKGGSPSAHAEKWKERLASIGLPEYHLGAIQIPTEEKPGNPNSHAQIKDWLFSLGWEPNVFKYSKKKDGSISKVPQLAENGELTDSVKDLIDQVPELKLLEGYFMINHRIGILEGFLECISEDGYLKAEISGFTNTLRMQHRKPIVNLPTVGNPYGKEIRECLIAPNTEEYLICGSDMSSLEDSTKQHYMYYYDPDYVKEMRVPGFDPHIDIAVLAEYITKEDQEFYKYADKAESLTDEEKVRYKAIKKIRGEKAKKVNFAGVYGAGAKKIALTGRMPIEEAIKLHTTYWKRNKAVKDVAKYAITKEVEDQMWLYNPVSKFWYSLRAEKDKFSTLNQGTGVYCFDTWVSRVRAKEIEISIQYHDEIMFYLFKQEKENTIIKLNEAIAEVNDMLRLNVPLGISIDFGNNYADVH